MKKFLGLLAVLLGLATGLPAYAQLTGPVYPVGPITAGHCTQWYAPGFIEDAGAGCGTSSMVYPGAGLALSTGTAWSTSIALGSNMSTFLGYTWPTPVTSDVLSWNGTTLAWVANGGGSMVYPATGIPVSTGTAWAASLTTLAELDTELSTTILYSGGPLGTPSSGNGSNLTNVNAASVNSFTIPCTVPTLVSGDYLTNNGSTCNWAAVSGSGTMTDGSGTTVIGAIPYSSTTAHAYSLLASPTAGAGYYTVQFDPTSTTAVAPTIDQIGVATRSISGATTTDTVTYSDVLGLVVHDKAATGAVTETLPTPATLGNTKFGYTYCNDSAQTDTITPTTYTIAVNGGTAGSSISVGTGVCAQISVDPFNSTQWDAFTYGASSGGSAAFSTITTGTNTTATMTVGAGATITVTGSGVNNANQVNGATVATSAAALASNSSGQLIAATTTTYLIDSGTAFTLGTGTGACATDSVVAAGSANGEVTCTGTTGTSNLVVNLPTAPHGWSCTATDQTQKTMIPQAANTTTSVTFTGSVTASDDIFVSCTGF